MLKFSFDDLTVDGLRKLADYYGVPRTATMPREELLSALMERMAPGAQVVLGQEAKPWWKTPSTIIAGSAALIAFFAMCASWYSIQVTVGKDVEQKKNEGVRLWQEVVVYKIIQEGTKAGEVTISFEDIRQRYLNEAIGANVVGLKKEELQEWPLRKILQDLMALQLVYQTLDDKFCIQRSAANPRADRIFLEEKAKYAILNVLSREGGKHTYLELAQVITDKLRITNDEYNTLMNQLMASNLVLVGDEMKLYSISSIPRKRP